MKLTRQLPTQTRRDAWVEINLATLERNMSSLKRYIGPERKLMAILKADAYGHGAVMCVPTLEASGVEMIGVASMDEAIQIRQAGIELPILVIGMVPDWSLKMAIEHDIQITVFDTQRLESLRQVYQLTGKPVQVQVKVDTGMHRIGVDWQQAVAFIQTCQTSPFLRLMGLFSHFADTADSALTHLQLDRWQQVLSAVGPLPPYVHIANSGGTMHYPEVRSQEVGAPQNPTGTPKTSDPKIPGNMVRLGMAMFGYDTDLTRQATPPQASTKAGISPSNGAELSLKPVMGLKARIIHLQNVAPESGVSYGHRYKTPAGQPSRIATLPLGYADGVPRCLSNRITGLIRGHIVPQVGTITMDQMMFNVSGLPDADPAMLGETITLLGEEVDEQGQRHVISLTDWASLAGTIEYELMCALRVRLPKTYTR